MMHNKEHNERLISQIKQLVRHKEHPVYFDQPVIVKPTPHNELYRCYGIVHTSSGEVKLMNPEGVWDDINADQANVGYVLQSVFQRLKVMHDVLA